MQDRPTLDELLEAVARYLRDDVMANTTGRTQFHGRVAMNAVEMVRREIASIEEHYGREWDGLDHVLGTQPMPPRMAEVREGLVQRNRELSERIRNGDADSGDFRHAVFNHLRKVIHDKLVVSNPALAAEGT
jgi:hypothetical protein